MFLQMFCWYNPHHTMLVGFKETTGEVKMCLKLAFFATSYIIMVECIRCTKLYEQHPFIPEVMLAENIK